MLLQSLASSRSFNPRALTADTAPPTATPALVILPSPDSLRHTQSATPHLPANTKNARMASHPTRGAAPKPPRRREATAALPTQMFATSHRGDARAAARQDARDSATPRTPRRRIQTVSPSPQNSPQSRSVSPRQTTRHSAPATEPLPDETPSIRPTPAAAASSRNESLQALSKARCESHPTHSLEFHWAANARIP
jgi:hypothetical protein